MSDKAATIEPGLEERSMLLAKEFHALINSPEGILKLFGPLDEDTIALMIECHLVAAVRDFCGDSETKKPIHEMSGCEYMKCTDYKDGECHYGHPVCKYRDDDTADAERDEVYLVIKKQRDALRMILGKVLESESCYCEQMNPEDGLGPCSICHAHTIIADCEATI